MTDSHQPDPALRQVLERLRRQLLDISKRNRLTNTPVGKRNARQLEVVDERSDEVLRILYAEGKKMTFEADPDATSSEANDAGEPGERTAIVVPADGGSSSALAAHHLDSKLRTALAAEPLQKRLLTLYRGARSLEEEQGVSVLFLAVGFLRWYDSVSPEIERFAPLILLPVDLERQSARGRFRLVFRDQDLDANLSLRAMLETDFALKLPDLPDGADWRPSSYFEQVRGAVSSQPRWRVDDDAMVLGFYSFAKFLMWRDLAPENDWFLHREATRDLLGSGAPRTADAGKSLVSRLLVHGFEKPEDFPPPPGCLDERFPDPGDLGHILDADASQTQVIAAARDGHSMVVQGPPGTGKSQTIANIIAVAVRDGKRVLFVAEKRAALEVVHARLEQSGLGPLCLELHSHKAVRRHVYGELKRTLESHPPADFDGWVDALPGQVCELRDKLNRVSTLLHEVDDATGETPCSVIGQLALLDGQGVARPDFLLDGADRWSEEEYGHRQHAAGSLADSVAEHGTERQHPWRGARRRLTQIDRRALRGPLDSAQERFRVAKSLLEQSADQTGLPPAGTFGARREAIRRLEALADAPELVGPMLAAEAVLDRLVGVRSLFEELLKLQEERSALLEACVESALDVDWAETRLDLGAHGDSVFRWFSRAWRRATARLKAALRPGWHGGFPEQIELLDRLVHYRKRRLAVEREDALGRAALEHAWKGEATDLSGALPALSWILAEADAAGSVLSVKQWFEGVPDGLDCIAASERLRGAFTDWAAALEAVVEAVDLDPAVAFPAVAPKSDVAGPPRPSAHEPESPSLDWSELVQLEEMDGRLADWVEHLDRYDAWCSLRDAATDASANGLDPIRERLADGRLQPETVRDLVGFVRADALWERFRRDTPELECFRGDEQTKTVESYRSLDARLLDLARYDLAHRHFEALPAGAAGQIGIIRAECNKKARHMPLRKLLGVAGEAVAKIKPVFLMSPLSVAQFLRPGGLTFDLLLIDEASQVKPADAMGAVLRADQVIVVGDQKQLPPTSFFDRQISGEEIDEDDDPEGPDVDVLPGLAVADMESILSLCEARAMTPLMLEWHYRSMHPSLIEVSNSEFYDARLKFPPSPTRVGGEFGLSFRRVDGVYDRGGSRNNPQEAEAVVDAVLCHARERPGRSLGVVALSVAQRDAIEDRIEYLRSSVPELDAFCGEEGAEPFFVKNLENVQGDERDVIFISIGYGKDAEGKMTQNFGPVSGAGGERRLNVLFTRAKRQCQVFSSITHDDVRASNATHRGPGVLRRFLEYARTAEVGKPIGPGEATVPFFERAVAAAIEESGHKVVTQVGSASFQIDLAVRDPSDEGRFLLAVECDGARYHSASWARERDRLRQAVLEQKGWTFHRVWSMDWLYDRDAELKKLLEAVEQACRFRSEGNGSRRVVSPEPPPVLPPPPPEPLKPPKLPRVPYREASFDAPSPPVELHKARLDLIADCVAKIVEVEGPVHVEEVGRRLSRLWGYKRTGRRIQERVAEAVTALARRELVRVSGSGKDGFLEAAELRKIEVRDRGAVESTTLRKVDMLPPVEVRAAILEAVERNIGINLVDCAREVARAFGFERAKSNLRLLVEAKAEELVAAGRLVRNGEELRLP